MKKMLIAASSVALLLGACSDKTPEFKVTATGLPEESNGSYAYVYDAQNQPIDSVQIQNGGFTYVTPANDTIVNVMNIQGTPVLFTPEAGDYTITYATDSITGEPILRRGGADNSTFVKVQSLDDELAALGTKYGNQFNEIKSNVAEDGTYTEEQKAKLYELQDAYNDEFIEVNRRYFDGASNSVINVLTLQNLSTRIPAKEFVTLYDNSGALVKANEDLTTYYETAQAATRTDVGEDFVDVQLDNGNGEVKNLSDFRLEGKYFIVDFFASWCGPCKASMPVLSEINKEFGKDLSIVSVAVFDKYDDFAKVVDELKVNWAHFFDANNAGANAYGVVSIPTFVLVNPDGKIIARTHDVTEIQNKLREELKK